MMDSKVNSTRAISMPSAGWLNGFATAIKKRLTVTGGTLLLLAGGIAAFVWWNSNANAADYVTDKVSRGSVEVNVSATGTVQAVTTVQVGSQVSGTVAWLGADFKSHVTRGQVIARLDPALIQAQVDTSRANLINAQAGVQAAMTEITNQAANVEAAKANDRANAAARDDAIAMAKRNEQLKGVIPDRDIEASDNAARIAVARYSQATSQIGQAQAQLEISKSKLKQAQAAVKQAEAQLQQAAVNQEHTVITSPIDGVVVSRSVDVGQTVAASLSAPTLFTIANDLTNMQVLASIDEADVGQVREGGKASFTVDAYPGQTFRGDINQVRLNAQTLQNVVTYTAVINVANPGPELMPGMTANITILVARRDDVLRVPNAALRFKPELTDAQQKDLQAKMDTWRQQQRQGAEEAAPPPAEAPSQPQAQANNQTSGEQRQQGQGRRRGEGRRGNQATSGQNSNAESATSNASSENSSGRRWRRQQQGEDGNAAAATGEERNSQRRRRQTDQAASPAKSQTSPAKPQTSPALSDSQTQSGDSQSGSGRRQVQVIWILNANKVLEPHFVRTGLTDGRFTEIVSGDLKEGDLLVIGQTGSSSNNNNQQTTTPFGRPTGAGGGRGRR